MDRLQAYTTSRPDICAMVPENALLILDLGCSDGSLGAALKQMGKNRRVYGIELSSELACIAESRLDMVIVEDLNHENCLAKFADERFDCVVAADVLEHLVAPERLLAQITNIMADNATLIVSLPNIRHHSAFTSIYLAGRFPRRDRGIFDYNHLRWFTLKDARYLLQSAGFTIEAEHYTLRVGDKGSGLINKIALRTLSPIASFAPVREFMTYQFVLRAHNKCHG
ncbi:MULTISPECIES: class I SAM-dependent methyltransferase [Sulfuricystis]|uniref:class I SAM-dependent methyltransferase n=1 Tax=Sulfuricystis TaxID=3050898 RepID=UPI000F832E69|nr:MULTISPECIES: class I SAM-dependent methyltransferase [Sulfuricystis]